MFIPHPYELTTAKESRQLDHQTINNFGIDGYTLMEIAGSKMAARLLKSAGENMNTLVVCGKGNNGGDGLVVARYLVQHGHSVTIIFVSATDDLSTDARKNYELLQKMCGHKSNDRGDIHFLNDWNPQKLTEGYDCIIDAMLGTGLDSNLRGKYSAAANWINKQNTKVCAVDIPTGLNSDTGKVMGEAVTADTTFSFGTRKLGCYLNQGPSCAGDVIYCDLPFPNYLKTAHTRYLLSEEWVNKIKPQQPPQAKHKYDAGILYVIAGSEGLTGAAIMAARSAWAEGLGAVMIIAPRGIIPVLEPTTPQIIKKPVGIRDDVYFKTAHLNEVVEFLEEKPGTVLLGPGIGRQQATVQFVCELMNNCTSELVVDADALWALAQQSWNTPEAGNVIFTPHPGELNRLTAFETGDGYKRMMAAETFARQHQITMVSKGYPAIVSTPDTVSVFTGYDTRIFTRAGYGDVLAGKIGANMALGYTPLEGSLKALWSGYQKSLKSDKKILEPADLI